MSKQHVIACLVGLALTGLRAGPALSQDPSISSGQAYPVKPVRIVTSPAGGGNDFPARLIARGISGPLGQQVIVDNRPAILAPEIVAKSAPDGYTVLVAGGGQERVSERRNRGGIEFARRSEGNRQIGNGDHRQGAQGCRHQPSVVA